MLAAAVLAFFIFDHVLIISTAVLGGYLMVRGVACYAGHYYNEFTIIKMIDNGLID